MDEGKTRIAGPPSAPPQQRKFLSWWRYRTRTLISIGMRVGQDNISILAAGVAFYVFVGIPSGLAAVVSVYGLMFDPAEVERQFTTLTGILPPDVINILESFLGMLATKPQSSLGVRLLVGLFIALWSAQSASSSMITALNAVYEKEETRSYLRFQLSALILALCSIIFAFLALCLSTLLPLALSWFPLAGGTRDAIRVGRWALLGGLIAFAIAGIYRFAPAQDGQQRGWGIWGVALTTIVWIGSSALFAVYVTNLASYDASYGSLGAVVVLLLWIYLAVFVVLLGAELNAALTNRTDFEGRRA